MIQTRHLIGRVCVGLLLLFLACRSSPETPAEKDVATAIDQLSTTREVEVSRVLETVALVQRHPKQEALAALVRHLDASKPTRRRSAMHLIQTIAWEDATPALPALRKLLTHSEAATRGMAAMALASVGDGQSFQAFAAMLEKDGDPYARRCAAWALGELKDQKATEHLKKALNDPDVHVKANAENALERLSFRQEFQDVTGPAKTVYEGMWLITGSTRHQETRLRRAVAMIQSVDEPIRRPLLEKLKASPLRSVNASAVYALGPM